MAQKLYSVVRGTALNSIITKSAGASISTDAMRLTIDDANAGSKQEVLEMLDSLRNLITGDTWPPA